MIRYKNYKHAAGEGYNINNQSTHNATSPNGGSNVAAGNSSHTISAEDGQTPGTFMNEIKK